ncbi:hypothetical protein ACFLU6_02585 [Acidobacteriota bacterium]
MRNRRSLSSLIFVLCMGFVVALWFAGTGQAARPRGSSPNLNVATSYPRTFSARIIDWNDPELIQYQQGSASFAPMAVTNGCLDPSVNCTANDLEITDVAVTVPAGESCSGTSDTIELQFDVSIFKNSGGFRYDVGVWIAVDGGSVVGGDHCLREVLPTSPSPMADNDSDLCGDHDRSGTYVHTQLVTVSCSDVDVDGSLDPVNMAVSWFQNTGIVCNTAADLGAGTDAKCFGVDVSGVAVVPVDMLTIGVSKSASPTTVGAPGNQVTFTVDVTNDSIVQDFTLNSLTDDVFGDLTDPAGNVLLVSSTCSLTQIIAPGATYSCTFDGLVQGNGVTVTEHIDTVTGAGAFADGTAADASDDATVAITPEGAGISASKTAIPTSVVEPGDDVSYTVVVTNNSTFQDFKLSSLVDDIFGDLDGQGDCVAAQTIAAGNSYTCTFTGLTKGVEGDTHTNVVTATGVFQHDGTASAQASANVTFTSEGATISISKAAIPPEVTDPGGDVKFTCVVHNNSSFQKFTLEELVDSVFGDLSTPEYCNVTLPIEIDPSGDYVCTWTAFVDEPHENTVTAKGAFPGDDPLSTEDDADAIVEYVIPPIAVPTVAQWGLALLAVLLLGLGAVTLVRKLTI